MVTDVPRNAVIHAGWKVALRTDHEFPVDVAVWIFEPEHSRWRLTLGVSAVKRRGSTMIYERIIGFLENLPIELDDIRVLAPTATELMAIKMFVDAPKPPHLGSGYLRITNCMMDGYLIRDALVLWTRR